MKTLVEIKKILTKHKAEVQEKYKVSELGIFGSFVRGEQRKRGDIDILVEFGELRCTTFYSSAEIKYYRGFR